MMSARYFVPILSSESGQFLVGKTIPDHISSLPEDFLNTPFGQTLRPYIDGAFAGPPPQAPVQTIEPAQSQPTTAHSQQNIKMPTTVDEFNTITATSKLAIAFFTSETCGPCKMIEPHFQSLAVTNPDIAFIHIDTQRSFPVARQHHITATPTFKSFLQGTLYSEWKGANISSLNSNLARLIEASKPPLPPSLRGHYSQSPVLFPRRPPIHKVIPALPPSAIPKPLLESISAFLLKGDSEGVLPPLADWAKCQRELDYTLGNSWMVLDLLRAAAIDRRVSGWFAIDGLDTISDIIRKVAARDEAEWQLRVVAVQLVSFIIVNEF
jgi:desumoylating isopeptidase 1